MVNFSTKEEEVWVLTAEGKDVAENGSHEAKVFAMIPPGEEGCLVSDIQVLLHSWLL